MPKINREEYEVLKELDDKWKWIARDDNYGGFIFCFREKPHKDIRKGGWSPDTAQHRCLGEYELLFQFIHWEDEEPYNIAELIEEYEKDYKGSWEHAVEFSKEMRSESEETEVKKDIEWLKNEVNELPLRFLGFSMLKQREEFTVSKDDVLELIDQLDEPEVLTSDWIDEHTWNNHYVGRPFVYVDDLQNLLVPKQEEVDRAYKDGYEKGKEYTFYKGYLEGLEDKGSEPETVADVIADFFKSLERLKEVMSMEVEELEE